MKLLLAADAQSCASLDGPGPWLDELTRHLVRRGHRVHVIVRDATAPPAAGVEPRPFAAGPDGGPSVARVPPGSVGAAFLRALSARPDAVHLVGAVVGSEVPADVLAREPVLLDLWDFEAVCPTRALLRNPGGLGCGEAWPSPACERCAPAAARAAMDLLRPVMASAARVLARSAWSRDRLSRTLGRPLEWSPPGVDTLRFRPEPDAAATARADAIVHASAPARVWFAGTPSEAHGAARLLDLLVALHARVPGVRLLVTGRDPADPRGAEALATEARELGLADTLELLPDADPADLPALLGACDLAIAPGLAPEPHGLAIVQAMACARPVVAHPAGAVLELIRHGEEGCLVPASDVAGFAGAVAALLRERSRADALGAHARLAAMERHDLEPAVFALEETYRRLRVLRPAGLRDAA